MKTSGALAKNHSGLTSSTVDNSTEKLAGSSFELASISYSATEDQLTAAETRRSNGKFFLRQHFSQNSRGPPKLAGELEDQKGNICFITTADGSTEGRNLEVRSKATLEDIPSNESSESELSDSDDKLHRAFNIDPVLTMIPRIRKYNSLQENHRPREFRGNLSVEEELRTKFQKATNLSKKSSLRLESEVWSMPENEKGLALLSSTSHGFRSGNAGYCSPPHNVKKPYSSFLSTDPCDLSQGASFRSPQPVTTNYQQHSHKFQNATNENKINLDRIVEVAKTALYIKNIPNKYTKKMLLKMFDREFKHAYDFFYLPIDFNNNCNIGFAFIKFIDVKYVRRFCEKYGNRKWPHFNSEKICEIRYARMQRAEEMIDHFKNSSLWRKADASCLPFMVAATRPTMHKKE